TQVTQDMQGRTALMRAAETGNLGIVNDLLSHGAQIDVADHKGNTALSVAADQWPDYACAEVLKLLLQHGANVNCRDSNGKTPLLEAVNSNYQDLCELLIDYGANVNCRDFDGLTPLLVAASYNRPELCELLIDCGADVKQCDVLGRDALWFATKRGRFSCVVTLLRHGAPWYRVYGYQGPCLLSIAALEGYHQIVNLYLRQGLDAHRKDDAGMTPLHYAAQGGYRKACESLLAWGADIDAKDDYRMTPLILAAKGGHEYCIEALLRHNPRIDHETFEGETALSSRTPRSLSYIQQGSRMQLYSHASGVRQHTHTHPHLVAVKLKRIRACMYMCASCPRLLCRCLFQRARHIHRCTYTYVYSFEVTTAERSRSVTVYCVRVREKMAMFERLLEQFKIHRENVKFDVIEEQREFVHQLYSLAIFYKGQSEVIRDILRPKEIERLLWINIGLLGERPNFGDAKRFIDFLIKIGYIDDPTRDGADPNLARLDGSTILLRACKMDCATSDKLVKLFCQCIDEASRPGYVLRVNASDEAGRTPLHYAVARFLPRTVETLLNRGADLTSFVFPTTSHFEEGFDERKSDADFGYRFKLAHAALRTVDCLEHRGYELRTSDSLAIAKFLAKHGLLDHSWDLVERFRDDPAIEAANITTTSSKLSLAALMRSSVSAASAKLRPEDYTELWNSGELWQLPEGPRAACAARVSEIMWREFFQRWAVRTVGNGNLTHEAFTNKHLLTIGLESMICSGWKKLKRTTRDRSIVARVFVQHRARERRPSGSDILNFAKWRIACLCVCVCATQAATRTLAAPNVCAIDARIYLMVAMNPLSRCERNDRLVSPYIKRVQLVPYHRSRKIRQLWLDTCLEARRAHANKTFQ
ncbi:unnamed protein product, partial [Trichogramma brassicae]